MRWVRFTGLGLATAGAIGAGCSILYNPNNISEGGKDAAPPVDTADGTTVDAPRDAMPDAIPDAPPDAPPGAFALDSLYPTRLLEGQGAGGSRRAALVIRGQNIVPTATVAITPRTGDPISVVVHDADKVVNSAGTVLVVPVTVEVDPGRGRGIEVEVDVTLSQTRNNNPEMQTLQSLKLAYLDELTAATNPTGMLAPGIHVFSMVDLPSLSASATTAPLVVRSTSSLRITGLAQVNAMGQMPGAGGNRGGDGGAAIGGTGQMGAGMGGGKPSGGGGGFAMMGGDGASAMTGGAIVGDLALSNLDTNRSSGGAGGNAGALSNGGAGGGGGGTIELSADGDLVLAGVQANGGNGANGNLQGGGGSGGAILLRAGGTATLGGAITASGGSGDGNGSVGRIRLDAPVAQVAINATPGAYRGPRFAATTPLVVTVPRPMLTVVGAPLRTFRYYFSSEDGSGLAGPFELALAMSGSNTFTPPMDLFEGANLVCTQVEGADFAAALAEARNCITLVYLP